MPKSLYSENAKDLMLNDSFQDIYMVVHPLQGNSFVLDAENDIVQGSVSIDRYCTTGNDVELGSACSSELKFQLYNDKEQFNDIAFEGAEIFVNVTQRAMSVDRDHRIEWDASMWDSVSVAMNTSQVRITLSNKDAVSGPFTCSHFPYKDSGSKDETYITKTSTGIIRVFAPKNTLYFGDSFTGVAADDKDIVVNWLINEYISGTPLVITESIEVDIPATSMSLGYFTVDEAPRKTQTMTVKALDRMAQFSKVFDKSTVTFPCSIDILLRAICSKVNIPYNEESTLVNKNIIIPDCPNKLQDMDYTYRDYLIWIGEITGTCSYVDEAGQLTFARYEDFGGTTAALTPDMRLENTADLYEEDVVITGVQATLPKHKYLHGEAGKILNIENNQLLNQLTTASVVISIVDNIYNAGWGGLTYRIFSATCKSMPYLWPLDKVKYETLSGEVISTIITNSTWTLNANSLLKAKGTTPTRSAYAKSDYMTSRERAIINAVRAEETQALSSMEQATLQLNNMIYNSLGLYFTVVENDNGAKQVYAHNSTSLNNSTAIFTVNSGGFAWTNSGWDGDDTVWHSGVDKNGNAVLKAITAYHISADDIEAGTLRSQNNQSWINLNNGRFNLGNDALTWNGSTLAVKGKITATDGSIGGWNITSTSLHYDGNGYGIGLYPQRINDASQNVISVWHSSTEKFTVKGDGSVCCLDADITGKITADSGAIGGWVINNSGISKTSNGVTAGLNSNQVGLGINVFYVRNGTDYPFYVTGTGVLHATGVDVSGKITADSGAIGGWVIDNGLLTRSETLAGYVNKISLNPASIGATSDTAAFSIIYQNEYTIIITQKGHIGCTNGLSADGTITFGDVYGATSSATSSYVRIASNGKLFTTSSSKRYKRDITTEITAFSPGNLLLLSLKQYKYNKGHFADNPDCDDWYCGFVAEDVAELYPHAAIYDAKGNVEMWDVERIVPPMLDLIQKIYKRVESLENRLEVSI